MDCCGPRYRCIKPVPKRCFKRCVGTYSTKHRVYANCYYDVCRVCACCGREYDAEQEECPMCGAPGYMMSMDADMDMDMDDEPGNPDGFGRFGGFGFRRRRFGFPRFGFFPFFPFFPFFGFRRRRFRRF